MLRTLAPTRARSRSLARESPASDVGGDEKSKMSVPLGDELDSGADERVDKDLKAMVSRPSVR